MNKKNKFDVLSCDKLNRFRLWWMPRQTANGLFYVVWDFQVCPTTFDFINFLCHAENERLLRGFHSFLVIIVPGPVEGFRDNNSYSIENKKWRTKNIIHSLTYLQPKCEGFYQCPSREEASRILEKIPKNQILPFGYTVENPNNLYSWKETFKRISDGNNLQTLRSRYEPRRIVREWLANNCAGKIVITITLRESEYEPERNSDISVWEKFSQEIDKNKYSIVLLRDQGRSLQDNTEWKGTGVQFFEAAVWDVELRQALYEYADLNFMINNGPFVMAVFSENIKYAIFRMVTEEIFVTSSEHLIRQGWTIEEDFPSSGLLQRIYWENETLEKLLKVCEEITSLPDKLLLQNIDLEAVSQALSMNVDFRTPVSALEVVREYKEHARELYLKPNEWFDEKLYRLSYDTVEQDIEDGVYNSGFEHYLLVGRYKNYVRGVGEKTIF